MNTISAVARRRLGALVLALWMILFACPGVAENARPLIAERIDLIRHGESEDNLEQGQTVTRLDGTLLPSRGKVLSGWNAASLTMRGVAQAVKAGELLRAWDKREKVALRDALWLYSPLLRTRQTLTGVLLGAELTELNSVKIRADTRLFERSAGSLTNLTWEEAGAIWPEMKRGRNATVFTRAEASYPDGESLASVYLRAADALDEALSKERRVIVVSHELTIKAILAHLLRRTIDDTAFLLKVENARPISLARRNGAWEIMSADP